MYSYSLANIHDFIGSRLMMKKENVGAATFWPRRCRSRWPTEKGKAQKHAARCIRHRSTLHPPLQRAAHAIAAHCIPGIILAPPSPHWLYTAKQAPSKAGNRSWQPTAQQTLLPPKTTARSQKKHGSSSQPESLHTPDIRPQETEKSTLYCPETLKPVKRSWEKLKKKPYLCSP